MKTCQPKKIDEKLRISCKKQPLILRKYLPKKKGYDPEKKEKSLVHAFQLIISNHRVKTIEKILKKEKRKKSIDWK